MSQSLLYSTNTASTSVNADQSIPFTTIVRRKGKCINLVNNGAVILQQGYYLVTADITYTASSTGDIVFSVSANDTEIVGANASQTITTASSEVNSISITCIVRKFCYNAPIVVNVSADKNITTSNASISVVAI